MLYNIGFCGCYYYIVNFFNFFMLFGINNFGDLGFSCEESFRTLNEWYEDGQMRAKNVLNTFPTLEFNEEKRLFLQRVLVSEKNEYEKISRDMSDRDRAYRDGFCDSIESYLWINN
jgi:hypothetical protein